MNDTLVTIILLPSVPVRCGWDIGWLNVLERTRGRNSCNRPQFTRRGF